MGVGIVRREGLAILTHRRGAGDVDKFAYANRAAVGNLFLQRRAGKNTLDFHCFAPGDRCIGMSIPFETR